MNNKGLAAVAAVCLVVILAGAYLFSLSNDQPENMGYDYKGQVSPYLHEIEVDDYIDDPMLTYVSDHIKKNGGGCSSVRNGDFVGRNFDYFYNEVPTFVIKTNASENRFASIGVAQHWGITEKNLISGKCWNDLKYLPNLTLDGVNENGVYINDNVVRIWEGHEVTTGTNPDAELTVHFLYIPRFILDNAMSADNAIELIESVNIVGSLKDKYYLHFMIADADNTYIVEACDNQLYVEKKTGNEQVMTNYYVNVPLEDTMYPLGIERMMILQENYDLGSTFDGMYLLMQMAKFSNITMSINMPWFSDPEIFSYKELKEIYDNEGDYYESIEEWEKYMDVYRERFRGILNTDDRSIGIDWITIHNSTYDIKNFKLQVIVDEDYLHPHTYYLFPQNE